MSNIKRGFSLMELIVVIIIIGILISAIVGMGGAKDSAKITSAKEQIINMKKTVDSYLNSKNKTLYSDLSSSSDAKHDIEEYISSGSSYKFPQSPWGTDYTITGDGSGLHISTEVGDADTCIKLKTILATTSSSNTCSGNLLTVDFKDWN